MPPPWDDVFGDGFNQIFPDLTVRGVTKDSPVMETSQDSLTLETEMALPKDLRLDAPVEEPLSAPSQQPAKKTKQTGRANLKKVKQETSRTSHRELRPRRMQKHITAKAATAPNPPSRARGRPTSRRNNESKHPKQETPQGKVYEVEAIMDTCIEAGSLKKYYLVKWKGYGAKQNTWEPKQNLTQCRAAIEAFEMRQARKAKKAKKRVLSS